MEKIFLFVLFALFVSPLLAGPISPPYELAVTGNVTVVYLNIIMNSLSKIDGVEEQFSSDFFLSAYWYDPTVKSLDEDTSKFVDNHFSPFIEFTNNNDIKATLEQNYFIHPPNTLPIPPDAANRNAPCWVEYDNRYVGNFKATLRLQDFPWDRQTASIIVDSLLWDSTQVVFLPNVPEFVDNLLPKSFTMVEWNFDDPKAEIRYGDKYYPIYNASYSNFRVDILLKRDATYYLSKIVSGVILLVYMAIFVFALEVNSSDRMMGTITVFLAIITYVFISNSDIPKVAYRTRIDSFFVFSFFIVFVIFISHAILYFYRPDEDDEPKVQQHNQDSNAKPKNREKRLFTMHTFHLPDFHELTKQRRMDLILVIVFAFGYAIGLFAIFLRPVHRISTA